MPREAGPIRIHLENYTPPNMWPISRVKTLWRQTSESLALAMALTCPWRDAGQSERIRSACSSRRITVRSLPTMHCQAAARPHPGVREMQGQRECNADYPPGSRLLRVSRSSTAPGRDRYLRIHVEQQGIPVVVTGDMFLDLRLI